MSHNSHERHLKLLAVLCRHEVAVSKSDVPQVLDDGLVLFHRISNRAGRFKVRRIVREVSAATVNTDGDRVKVFRPFPAILVSCFVVK